MSCRRTVKPQYNADLLFSKDQIVIKRSNALISGMEYFKWDLQTNGKSEMQILQAEKKLKKIA